MACQVLFSGMYAFASDDAEPYYQAAELPEKFSRKSRTKVLVVDDERLIADTLSEILNHSGFEAVSAYNGNAAMAAIEQDCPDIVISDVIMPGVNGVELAKFVTRHVFFHQDLPAVGASGYFGPPRSSAKARL